MSLTDTVVAMPRLRLLFSASGPLSTRSSKVLSGSIIMLVGSAIVSSFNFGYNIAMARLLGPAAFGDVSAVATLLMLASAVTLSFQMVCAKFVARNESPAGKYRVFHALMRKAWIVGIAAAALLVFGRGIVTSLLTLRDPNLVVLLAIGIACYVPLGVKRGAMQGLCEFKSLTLNFVIEVMVKFGAALAFVIAGYGVLGAVGALTASVVAAFLFPGAQLKRDVGEALGSIPASFREGMQAIVFFVGQVVINNIDILLVKYFFSAPEAGLYAAVALVGRVLYFAAWSIVSAMFPISAATEKEEESRQVVLMPLVLVLSISGTFAVALAAFPHLVVGIIFGKGFVQAEPLLSLYAVATGLYALSVVLMAYEMSRKIANTGWLQLVVSGLLVALIGIFHDSLRQVILVQIALMVLLLALVSLPFLRAQKRMATLQEAA
jgi:O-antigen/teichoic acid export membrane protein